jgi:hypothetical protein
MKTTLLAASLALSLGLAATPMAFAAESGATFFKQTEHATTTTFSARCRWVEVCKRYWHPHCRMVKVCRSYW